MGRRGREGQLSPDRIALLDRLVVVAAVGWSVAVAVALWMPPPPVVIPNVWLDKVTHLTLFVGVGGLWRWVCRRHVAVLVGATAFAALTEVGQGWLPWPRQPDVADFGFDVLGVVVGMAVAGWIRPPWRSAS